MNLHSNDGTHGPTGLGTLTLPAAQHKQFDPRIAAQVIYETAVEEKGRAGAAGDRPHDQYRHRPAAIPGSAGAHQA